MFATPRGLFCDLSHGHRLRSASSPWYTGEPVGDPILTGIDWRVASSDDSDDARAIDAERSAARSKRSTNPIGGMTAHGPASTDVTYVVVAARRKPGWTKGTWVITSDGWFTLGEPFDRPMPNGLRTVYPLTLQTIDTRRACERAYRTNYRH